MDPHTGVLAGLKVMVDRAARWKFSWQQSPLAACPQEVKDGVEDGTKVGGARSAARSRRRQNWRNPGPRRVGQVGVVESRVHRTVPLARFSALSRQTSTFQTPSQRVFEKSPQLQGLRRPSPDVSGNRPDRIQPHARSIGETTTFQTPSLKGDVGLLSACVLNPRPSATGRFSISPKRNSTYLITAVAAFLLEVLQL